MNDRGVGISRAVYMAAKASPAQEVIGEFELVCRSIFLGCFHKTGQFRFGSKCLPEHIGAVTKSKMR